MPGLHINDRQMRLYMRSRHTGTPATAAARAGFSTATAYRIDADPEAPVSEESAGDSWLDQGGIILL